MKSPFPGMDPYLEQHWGDVHTGFMVYARNQLNQQLPPDLQARVEESLSVESAAGTRLIYLDVRPLCEPRLPHFARPATRRRGCEMGRRTAADPGTEIAR